MKRFVFFGILTIFLCLLTTPGYSGYLRLGGAMYAGAGVEDYLLVGKQVNINWSSKDIDLQTKVKLTLLKNGVPFRVIAKGLSLTNGYKNIMDEWCNDTNWTPANSDMGCNYKVQISTEDNPPISDTSRRIDIFPVEKFVSQGKYSYVKLDSPKGGEIVPLGKNYMIKWTCIPNKFHWSTSPKLKLELFYNNSKIVDITNVNLNFNQCPIYGSYNWMVGSNLTAGNFYQIKVSGDSSIYLSDNFIIAYPSSKPGSGEKVHKIDQSGVGIDGPSSPPGKKPK